MDPNKCKLSYSGKHSMIKTDENTEECTLCGKRVRIYKEEVI